MYMRLLKDYMHGFCDDIINVDEKTAKYMIKNNIAEKIEDVIDKEEYDIIEDFSKTINNINDGEKKNNKKNISNFVFDDNEVIKEENFIYCKINGKIGYGVYLEKNVDVYDKKGDYKGKEQRRVPVIITSDYNIIEIGENLNLNNKIRIRELPSEENYPLRWDRKDIQDFINNEDELTRKQIKTLFEEIKKTYKKYIYFNSEEWYNTQVLWDIGTYFFMLFDYYPIMELRGQKGTAKTKVMSISRLFSFNATEEMSNPSEATLFRETHDKRPTKYIDEAEKLYFFNPKTNHIEADPRAELINSGFKYTGSVPRQEKRGQKFVTCYYKTYSPTVCASINGLYGATEDRAIVHIMTKPKEMKKMWNREPKEDQNIVNLRNMLYRLGLQEYKSVQNCYKNIDEKIKNYEENVENVEKLENNRKKILSFRDYNIWTPLLSIADMIDEELFNSIYEFAKYQTAIKVETGINEGTNDYKIMAILASLCKGNTNTKVYIKEVEDNWSGDNKPASKTIGNYIDKAGFRDYKGRDSLGTYYVVNVDILNNIIYSTYSTLSTLLEEKKIEDKNVECKKSTFSSQNNEELNYFIKNNDSFSYFELKDYLIQKGVFNEDEVFDKLDQLKFKGEIIESKPNYYKKL